MLERRMIDERYNMNGRRVILGIEISKTKSREIIRDLVEFWLNQSYR